MVFVFFLVQLSAIPFYFYYRVDKVQIENSSNVDGYWLYQTNFALDHFESYQVVILWLYGVTMKLVPCFALVILSGLMIRTLWRTKRSRSASFSSSGSKWYSRTTIMLITIVLVYVCTALPIAIAAFIGGLEVSADSIHFFYFLTDSWLGNFYNLFPITNASVNFSIYLGMSRQFRRDFMSFFVKKEMDEHTQSSKENSTDCRLDSKEHTF
ncbi:hypothetical protein FSP39_000048 [Pinctada imbricata]|uniref:G-protein coupled receptors family 1 profile domain-containing protein n=1 Tax=Pinctada imbricata TaxID=66713 RepID=A0AA88Y9S7_PINIB|nr:hypothetical protein FSP39_000048 [Pinctada imbricata]